MITFLPGLELSDIRLKEDIRIKGKRPLLKYSYSITEIYSNTPVLNALNTYNILLSIFDRIDKILSGLKDINDIRKYPVARNNEEASRFIDILFNPFIKDFSSNTAIKKGYSIYEVKDLSPFSFEFASPEKLNHSFIWVDTNIKIIIEEFTWGIYKEKEVKDLVHSTLEIYCYLLKHDNYFLAKNINFNYSMFFQDRILELVLGSDIYKCNKVIQTDKTSNEIVLNFLRGFNSLTFNQLFFYSVFIGIIWTSMEERQKSFRKHKDNELGNIESEIIRYKKSWGINHSEIFVNEVVNSTKPKRIVVILDDNGESVVDIAIFQKLLIQNSLVEITFVINETPVSNNISLQSFSSTISDDYFSSIRKYIATGRIKVIIENQPFRSFELKYLSPEFFAELNISDLIYHYYPTKFYFS